MIPIHPPPHPEKQVIVIVSKKVHNYNTPTEHLESVVSSAHQSKPLNLESISLGVIKNPGQLENRCLRCGRQNCAYGDLPSECSMRLSTTNHRATHAVNLYQVLLDRPLNWLDNPHTNPDTTPRRCHACRINPRNWAGNLQL